MPGSLWCWHDKSSPSFRTGKGGEEERTASPHPPAHGPYNQTCRRLSVDSAPLSSFITYTHDIITGGDSLAKWTAAAEIRSAPKTDYGSIYILFTRLIIRSAARRRASQQRHGGKEMDGQILSGTLLLNAPSQQGQQKQPVNVDLLLIRRGSFLTPSLSLLEGFPHLGILDGHNWETKVHTYFNFSFSGICEREEKQLINYLHIFLTLHESY